MENSAWDNLPELHVQPLEPYHKALGLVPWHIREEIMEFLLPGERNYFDNEVQKQSSNLLTHKYTEYNFRYKKPRFSYHTAREQVGPFLEHLKIEYFNTFFKCNLIDHVPNLTKLTLGDRFSIDQIDYFMNFIDSIAGQISYLDYRAEQKAHEFFSIVGKFKKLDHLGVGLLEKGEVTLKMILKATKKLKLKSVRFRVLVLDKESFSAITSNFPELRVLKIINCNKDTTKSEFELDPSSLGEITDLTFKSKDDTTHFKLALNLAGSNVKTLNLKTPFTIADAAGTNPWPSVEELSTQAVSSNIAAKLGDFFPNLVKLRIDVSLMSGQTLGLILPKFSKLKFLKITAIMDPDYFKRFPKGVKSKVTHLEFLSETSLTIFTLEALCDIFPELFFLSLSFSHDIIMSHLMKDTTQFQKLNFLRLNLQPDYSALKVLSKVAPNLSAIYMHPDCLKFQLKNAVSLFPHTRILNMLAHSQYYV